MMASTTVGFRLSEAGLRDRQAREGGARRSMIPDPLATGRPLWGSRRACAPVQIRMRRLVKDKLSWRLSLLVILVLSLALWAAILEGVSALLQSR
jgi:hypothetical protein